MNDTLPFLPCSLSSSLSLPPSLSLSLSPSQVSLSLSPSQVSFSLSLSYCRPHNNKTQDLSENIFLAIFFTSTPFALSFFLFLSFLWCLQKVPHNKAGRRGGCLSSPSGCLCFCARFAII